MTRLQLTCARNFLSVSLLSKETVILHKYKPCLNVDNQVTGRRQRNDTDQGNQENFHHPSTQLYRRKLLTRNKIGFRANLSTKPFVVKRPCFWEEDRQQRLTSVYFSLDTSPSSLLPSFPNRQSFVKTTKDQSKQISSPKRGN